MFVYGISLVESGLSGILRSRFGCLGEKENPIGRDSQPGRDVECECGCVPLGREHTVRVHIKAMKAPGLKAEVW